MTDRRQRSFSATILGSGTCVPSLQRSACSVLVSAGPARILLDLGPGTMTRLLSAKTRIFDISLICLSHFHPDHCGELPTFLFATKYPDPGQRRSPLVLAAGAGLEDFIRRMGRVWGRWIQPPAGLTLMEMANTGSEPMGFEHFALSFCPTAHNPESVAFRIETPDGRSMVYSGDTDLCESLVDLARGTDLLICESALPDERRVPGHLTPSLAGEIAARAKVKKLVLTHFYPECEDADMTGQCRKTWDGPLVLAEDLMEIEIG